MKFKQGDPVITGRKLIVMDTCNEVLVPVGTRGTFVGYLSTYQDKRIAAVGGLIRREEDDVCIMHSVAVLEDAIDLVPGKWHWGVMVYHSELQFTCLLELAERSKEDAEKELVEYLNRRYATAWQKAGEQYVRPGTRIGEPVLGYLISEFVEET